MKINSSIFLTLSLTSTILLSCIPLKDHVVDKREVKLNRDNLSILEGEYKIWSVDGKALLPYLINDCSFNGNNWPDSCDKVILTLLNKRKLKIRIIDSGTEVKSKILKGKIKNGYFETSTTELDPFWMIIIGVHHNKIRLGYLKNENLLIDYSTTHLGLLLFMPFEGSESMGNNVEFKKINKITNK